MRRIIRRDDMAVNAERNLWARVAQALRELRWAKDALVQHPRCVEVAERVRRDPRHLRLVARLRQRLTGRIPGGGEDAPVIRFSVTQWEILRAEFDKAAASGRLRVLDEHTEARLIYLSPLERARLADPKPGRGEEPDKPSVEGI